MLFAAQVSLADEAVRAAEGLGLKRAAAVAAISASSGSSYALARFFGGDDQVEMLERIRPYLDKDVDTARDALSALGCDLPLMRHAARWGSQ